MVRAILTWRILGADLVGTVHTPATAGNPGPGIGVLLLNAGAAPRAGNSDLSVHLAERLSRSGIPAFRFDFAGLGDSPGRAPLDLESYWHEVLEGRNDKPTLALVNRLRREFALEGVIVGGLCAAVVPALHAAERDPAAVPGVLLLEPNFRLDVRGKRARRGFRGEDDAARTELTSPGRAAPRARWSRALSRRAWLHYLTGDNRVARAARPLRGWLLGALQRTSGHTLPRDANVRLVQSWRRSSERGLRSLVVVAEGEGTDRYLARLLESFPPRAADAVCSRCVAETNHLFTSGAARDEVVLAVERWVSEHFGARETAVAREDGG